MAGILTLLKKRGKFAGGKMGLRGILGMRGAGASLFDFGKAKQRADKIENATGRRPDVKAKDNAPRTITELLGNG